MKNITKFCFLFIIILFGCDNAFSQVTYWEDLCFDTQMKMINDSNTYIGAVDYYYDKFKESDDSVTENLLDTLAVMREFNPLYFYVFNKIMTRSDGALGELFPEYCYKVFMRFPNEILNYTLKDSVNGMTSPFYLRYAFNIGFRLFFNHDKNDKELKIKGIEHLVEKFGESSEENKKIAKQFLEYLYMASRSELVD